MTGAKKICKAIGKSIISRRYRAKLRNKDFTILCSNCIGGVIYNLLGAEFLSPTVNLWINQQDFVRLCCDLPRYMEAPLCFLETDRGYPVARCADITIYFNHDQNRTEAEAKWERRKKRIRYDNLYIILYYGDGLTKEMLQKLESVNCKNKVVLSPADPGFQLPYLKVFHPSGESLLAQRGMDQDLWGMQTILKQFDFVSFLNEGAV